VTRGGSWYNQAWLGRSAFRTGLDPEVRDYSIGFRCALPAAPSTAAESVGPLSLSHSIESVTCASEQTYEVQFKIQVAGGTGTHTVYRDIDSQVVYGPGTAREFVYDLEWGAGHAAVGTLYARSGDMYAESKFFVNAPDCSGHS
jgi:hypothetical protein